MDRETPMATYAIVYWGSPLHVIRTATTAARAIAAAKSAIGTGNCTLARVYECQTKRLAKTASISRVRDGERIIWNG